MLRGGKVEALHDSLGGTCHLPDHLSRETGAKTGRGQ